MQAAELEYLRTLHNPFEHRQVRIPTHFPVATQCSTFHGNVSTSTNAAGFGRVYLELQTGTVGIFRDTAHTETVLGAATSLAGPLKPTGTTAIRLVSAGMRIRSTASFSNESGLIQSYMSL